MCVCGVCLRDRYTTNDSLHSDTFVVAPGMKRKAGRRGAVAQRKIKSLDM